MAMIIHGIASCDSCRKARKALPQARFRDFRDAPPEAEEIAQWLDRLGDALLNKASTTWRGLDPQEKEKTTPELLQAWPTLIKRPVIEVDGTVLLGWTPATRAALELP